MSLPSLDERLEAYTDLSEDERAAARDEVRAHRPDLTPVLEEKIALADVLAAVRSGPPDASEVLVDAHLGLVPQPPPEDVPPELMSHLERLASETEPPLAQFERLTGRRLRPLAKSPLPETGAVMSNGATPSVGKKTSTPSRSVTDRDATPRQSQSVGQRVVMAGLALTVVYAGLLAVSALRVSERARVADVTDVEASFRPVGSDISDQYAEAVVTLDDARRSTLGLFPRYDDDALDQAATAFETIARESPESPYGQEAALALGRIRLLQEDDDGARIALAAVVAQRGHRAPEAARLLDFLDAEARESVE